ncbi:MAG TPA: caspase family protein, partial [Pyrinomonadaceae bacterium]|nr:caspase family protein [Pyrinomonadaceae bacterium]
VGILEWQHSDSWESFPKEGRKDAELVEFFRQAGVPRDQILFIKDREATKERVQRLMARHLSRASEGDMLIFYFTGHGARDEETGTVYFANYDADDDLARTAWSVPSIFNSIERNFKGSRALLIADCCYSGALADEAVRRRTSIAYAALASARSDSTSTGEWTFTETLLRGFRGNARVDRDQDGEIELSELARYENARMRSVEGQATSFAATRNFPSEMVLAEVSHREVSNRRATPASERLEVEWQGEWYPAAILEVRGTRYRIHYLGYGSEWDEWVDRARLRRT